MVRKAYASQESVARTLTRAELAAPFRAAEPEADPLPRPTREPVLADDTGVLVQGLRNVIDFVRGDIKA